MPYNTGANDTATNAIDQNLQSGMRYAMGHRQHGNFGVLIVVFPLDRQRPEMRRRPGEYDQHQDQGTGFHCAGDRRPAEERWHGPREPSNHNILRGGVLKIEGIDERIPHQRGERE